MKHAHIRPRLFTQNFDFKYYLSILYERLRDMNELGGSNRNLQFDNDSSY